MLDEEQQKELGEWLKNHKRDYDEIWKTIKFRQRLKTIVIPYLKEQGFNVSDTAARVVEFTRVHGGIGDVITIDYLRNIVDRYRRPTIPGVGILAEFRIDVRILDPVSKKNLLKWYSICFAPPRHVLPWHGAWPFKDAATLDQLLEIFVREFEKRGNGVFELARSGASLEEIRILAGEALPILSEEEWDRSPWGKGDIVVTEASLE